MLIFSDLDLSLTKNADKKNKIRQYSGLDFRFMTFRETMPFFSFLSQLFQI